MANSAEAKDEHRAAVQALEEKHAVILQEVKRGHDDDLIKLTATHDAAIKDACGKAEQERSSLVQSHADEISKIKADHQATVAEVNTNLIAAQERHWQHLEEVNAQNEQLTIQHKEELATSLAEVEQRYSAEREALRRDYETAGVSSWSLTRQPRMTTGHKAKSYLLNSKHDQLPPFLN